MENILSCVELDLFNHLGELTNAKVHDVSYYCYENNIEESIFNDFCFDEWDFFENNIKEINVDILHLNPFTSSFYFINNDYNFNCYYLSSFRNATNEEKREMLLEEFCYHSGYYISVDEMLESDWNIEDIKASFKTYCYEILEPINEAYDTLNDFKKNQVAIFCEYLQARIYTGFFLLLIF